MEVKAWGAGGAGGDGGEGGGGAYATSIIPVTVGNNFRVVVGGRGNFNGPTGYNATDDVGRGGAWYGANSGNYGDRGGSGGQLSGAYLMSGPVIPLTPGPWVVIARHARA